MSPPVVRRRPLWSFVLIVTFTAFLCSALRDVSPSISECLADAWQWHIFPMAFFALLTRSMSPAGKNLILEWCCGSSWIWEERRPVARVSRDWRRGKSVSFPMSSCMIRSLKRTALLAESRKAWSSSFCRSRTFKRDPSKSSTSWTICSTWASTISTARFPACRMSVRTSSARLVSSVDTWSTAWRERSSFRVNSLSNLPTFSATCLLPLVNNVFDVADRLVTTMIADRPTVTTDSDVARPAVEGQRLVMLKTLRNDVFRVSTRHWSSPDQPWPAVLRCAPLPWCWQTLCEESSVSVTEG